MGESSTADPSKFLAFSGSLLPFLPIAGWLFGMMRGGKLAVWSLQMLRRRSLSCKWIAADRWLLSAPGLD